MPVTPFHFGPGLLAKGLAARHVSLTSFVTTQVVIDCETLYHMVRHEYPWHRTLHTLLVAGPVGMAVGLIIAAGHGPLRRAFGDRAPRLAASEVGPWPALLGGALGGLTHPLLDGVMHPDIRPFRPFTDANPLLGIIGLPALHLLCLVFGFVGLALVARRGVSTILVPGPGRG